MKSPLEIMRLPYLMLIILIVLIIVILLIMVALRIWKKWTKKGTFCGEDKYQSTRKTDTTDTNIYTTISYAKQFEYRDDDFRQYVLKCENEARELIKKYFGYHTDMNIDKRVKFVPETLDEEMFVYSECDGVLISPASKLWNIYRDTKSEYIMEMHYSIKHKRITFLKDHRYLGGVFFMQLAGAITDKHPITVYKEQYTPFLSELLIVKFASFWMSRQSRPRLKIGSSIKRIGFILNYTSISKQKYIRKQTVVMQQLLSMVINSTTKKTVDVMIPVAFDTTPDNFNNVGAIIIDYKTIDGYKSLQDKLISNKYQAVTTNNIQKIMDKGQYVRSTVDIVLTAGCLTSNDANNLGIIGDTSFTSFTNIAHYPIYILSMSIEDKSYVTITVMTDDVDMNKLTMLCLKNPYVTDVTYI